MFISLVPYPCNTSSPSRSNKSCCPSGQIQMYYYPCIWVCSLGPSSNATVRSHAGNTATVFCWCGSTMMGGKNMNSFNLMMRNPLIQLYPFSWTQAPFFKIQWILLFPSIKGILWFTSNFPGQSSWLTDSFSLLQRLPVLYWLLRR